jgi:hypothetical protein
VNILNPKFKYTRAIETDLRKTFERVRREMQQEVQSVAPVLPLTLRNQVSIFNAQKGRKENKA